MHTAVANARSSSSSSWKLVNAGTPPSSWNKSKLALSQDTLLLLSLESSRLAERRGREYLVCLDKPPAAWAVQACPPHAHLSPPSLDWFALVRLWYHTNSSSHDLMLRHTVRGRMRDKWAHLDCRGRYLLISPFTWMGKDIPKEVGRYVGAKGPGQANPLSSTLVPPRQPTRCRPRCMHTCAVGVARLHRHTDYPEPNP